MTIGWDELDSDLTKSKLKYMLYMTSQTYADNWESLSQERGDHVPAFARHINRREDPRYWDWLLSEYKKFEKMPHR